jgi:hypothetical protein
MALEKRGDQTALSAILAPGDMPDPCTPPFDGARERIFVTTQDSRYLSDDPLVLVVHRGMTLLTSKHYVRTVVREYAGPARHLSMPDVVSKLRISPPINLEIRIGHAAS